MALIPSPAVLRACDLLIHLAGQPTRAFTVTELARHLAIPRATCDSLLLGLAERGFVRRDAERRYELGMACLGLGDAARAANPALRTAGIYAEALARDQLSVIAVTIRDGDETRVASVFDFGPPFGIRPRPGDSIALVPPFGASFVAWDDAAQIQAWLDRAEPALTSAEVARYYSALGAVRARGYSITVGTGRQPGLASALQRLADGSGDEAEESRRARAEAIRTVTHSEYLAAEVDPLGTTRLTQVSAPVFAPDGTVAASILLLGPSHDVTASEVAVLGELVLSAASRATREIDGKPR
jgi:DNA-binding IclR family transcriptional regulator